MIFCENCENEVDMCDRRGCRTSFEKNNEIYCHYNGQMHFCCQDCFSMYSDLVESKCNEIED